MGSTGFTIKSITKRKEWSCNMPDKIDELYRAVTNCMNEAVANPHMSEERLVAMCMAVNALTKYLAYEATPWRDKFGDKLRERLEAIQAAKAEGRLGGKKKRLF